MKTFTYEKKEYTCTEQDILDKCGKTAKELVRCRKARYGFEVVYKMKENYYDDRDSGYIQTYIYYFDLVKKLGS